MRRDLSALRRLERIEKEIGYCEIKLEKEQRLLAQARFLRMHLAGLRETLQRFERLFEECVGASGGASGDGNELGGIALRQVQQQLVLHRESGLMPLFLDRFHCVGVLPFLRDEARAVSLEVDELTAKLRTFEPFHVKRERLVDERSETMEDFHTDGSEPLVEMSREFERTEQSWNSLTEDLMNADSALVDVTNAADYLAAARSFILVSRSQFQIESWLRTGYLVDLFKHSTLGRAKEMVEGAERNLRKALMELVCLEEFLIEPEEFEPLLLPFLSELFQDLFVGGKLHGSMQMLETRITTAEQLKKKLETLRDRIFSKQHKQEENRVRLYSRMGSERKKFTLTLDA